MRSGATGILVFGLGAATLALLEGIRAVRSGGTLDFLPHFTGVVAPAGLGAWLTVLGLGILAAGAALAVGAALVARHGIRGSPPL
jgi:hypothetical protein